MTAFPWDALPCTCPKCVDLATPSEPVRPELQKDAKGLLPGEAERGIPDFLRRMKVTITDVNSGPSLFETINRAIGPPATAQPVPLPWAAKS